MTRKLCCTETPRSGTHLKDNFNRDDLDDFLQTANSLREWIKEDASLSPEQKAHLEQMKN